MTSALKLKLRHLDPEWAQLRSWQRRWASLESVSFPLPDRRYLRFSLLDERECLTGMVDIVAWCQRHWAEIQYLAWECVADNYLLDIFARHSGEVQLLDRVWRLEPQGICLGSECQRPFLQLTDEQFGQLWLPQPPMSDERNTCAMALPDIAFNGQWLLGHSHISAELLALLAPGDALLIQQMSWQLRLEGHPVAHFQSTETGIAIVDIIDNAISDVNDTEAETAQYSETPPSGIAPEQLSVRLNFVLAEQQITLGELGEIYPGRLFTLPGGSEKSVSLWANQQLIARGELVWLGEALALEVKALLSPPGAVNGDE